MVNIKTFSQFNEGFIDKHIVSPIANYILKLLANNSKIENVWGVVEDGIIRKRVRMFDTLRNISDQEQWNKKHAHRTPNEKRDIERKRKEFEEQNKHTFEIITWDSTTDEFLNEMKKDLKKSIEVIKNEEDKNWILKQIDDYKFYKSVRH